jgi:hypothetical protein
VSRGRDSEKENVQPEARGKASASHAGLRKFFPEEATFES